MKNKYDDELIVDVIEAIEHLELTDSIGTSEMSIFSRVRMS